MTLELQLKRLIDLLCKRVLELILDCALRSASLNGNAETDKLARRVLLSTASLARSNLVCVSQGRDLRTQEVEVRQGN